MTGEPGSRPGACTLRALDRRERRRALAAAARRVPRQRLPGRGRHRLRHRRAALSPGNVGLQLFENAAATAAGLFAIILMFGPVSGAHFNPVVSFVDAAFGGLRWRDAARLSARPGGRLHRRGGLANVMFCQAAVSISTKHRASPAALPLRDRCHARADARDLRPGPHRPQPRSRRPRSAPTSGRRTSSPARRASPTRRSPSGACSPTPSPGSPRRRRRSSSPPRSSAAALAVVRHPGALPGCHPGRGRRHHRPPPRATVAPSVDQRRRPAVERRLDDRPRAPRRPPARLASFAATDLTGAAMHLVADRRQRRRDQRGASRPGARPGRRSHRRRRRRLPQLLHLRHPLLRLGRGHPLAQPRPPHHRRPRSDRNEAPPRHRRPPHRRRRPQAARHRPPTATRNCSPTTPLSSAPARSRSGPRSTGSRTDALGPGEGVHLLHSMGDTFAVMGPSRRPRRPAPSSSAPATSASRWPRP